MRILSIVLLSFALTTAFETAKKRQFFFCVLLFVCLSVCFVGRLPVSLALVLLGGAECVFSPASTPPSPPAPPPSPSSSSPSPPPPRASYDSNANSVNDENILYFRLEHALSTQTEDFRPRSKYGGGAPQHFVLLLDLLSALCPNRIIFRGAFIVCLVFVGLLSVFLQSAS